jgi:transcription elongation GreA/GreB family factor
MSESLKKRLTHLLLEDFAAKTKRLQDEIQSLESSRDMESKSTAGDKHEVGRAMAQAELENLTKRLRALKEEHSCLKLIDLSPSKSAQVGSLVLTSKANYFITVGYGKIEVDRKVFFCISAGSPIGQILLNKTTGESISFRNIEMEILELI